MKTKLFTLLLALVASLGTLFAYDANVGNLYYLLDKQNLTATVTYCISALTQGNWNGSWGTTLGSASIPETIDVTINDETKTFTVVAIGEKAFYNCKVLESVTMPNTIKSIGPWAFRDCVKLKNVQIGEGVTSIGEFAFYNCSSLPYLVIPDSVKSIGESAFAGCSSLSSVNMSEELTSLGEQAFANCSGLSYITLPDELTKIEEMTFYRCSSLATINIPYAVTEIGLAAFYNCPIEHIIWSAKNCAAYDFGDQPILFEFCGLVEVIPAGLCKGKNLIEHLALTAGGMETEESWIYIPSTVKVIGDSAFYGTNLAAVYIGSEIYSDICMVPSANTSQLESIGKDAFSNTFDLRQFDCWATVPPTLGEHVFGGIDCSSVTLRVPYQGENAYKKADQWKEFYIQLLNTPAEYTITFLNWDNTFLQEVQTLEGEMPQYTGETPTRPDDAEFTYIFKGWKPELSVAIADATYTATYEATPISEGIETPSILGGNKGRLVLRNGQIFILRGEKVYTLQGQEVK